MNCAAGHEGGPYCGAERHCRRWRCGGQLCDSGGPGTACARQGCKLYLPPLRLCGDNGAMIGAQGYYEYLAGHTAGMELNAYATRDIAE